MNKLRIVIAIRQAAEKQSHPQVEIILILGSWFLFRNAISYFPNATRLFTSS